MFITGHCPQCGAPVYSPAVWHGVTPPPARYSCSCIRNQTQTITTTNTSMKEFYQEQNGPMVPLGSIDSLFRCFTIPTAEMREVVEKVRKERLLANKPITPLEYLVIIPITTAIRLICDHTDGSNEAISKLFRRVEALSVVFQILKEYGGKDE